MSIVTKTGDDGSTGIVGTARLAKSHDRIHAYGTVDELNALLGVVLAEGHLPQDVQSGIERIQHELFTLGADLAAPLPIAVPRITDAHIAMLEEQIVLWEQQLPELQNFILPGGSKAGALLHHARTVCRRAERWMVALKHSEPLSEPALRYGNRLSDYLFLAARVCNRHNGQNEQAVRYR